MHPVFADLDASSIKMGRNNVMITIGLGNIGAGQAAVKAVVLCDGLT